MKAEINDSNRQRFFTLYWGQGKDVIWVDQIELKPLAQMSDEDKEHAYWPVYPTHVCVMNIDYLRSKGYALPWLGLSVEEMIEAGWIKIKS